MHVNKKVVSQKQSKKWTMNHAPNIIRAHTKTSMPAYFSFLNQNFTQAWYMRANSHPCWSVDLNLKLWDNLYERIIKSIIPCIDTKLYIYLVCYHNTNQFAFESGIQLKFLFADDKHTLEKTTNIIYTMNSQIHIGIEINMESHDISPIVSKYDSLHFL